MRRVIFFLLFFSIGVSGVECPPGFRWERMSGVGCVQTDCVAVGGSYGYTKNCLCRDMKSCSEFVDYSGFDKSKCGPNCPVSRLLMCVPPGQLCPSEVKSVKAGEAADSPIEVLGDSGIKERVETVFTTIRDFIREQGFGSEKDFNCETGIDEAFRPLDAAASEARRLGKGGKTDMEVAKFVVKKVKSRISTPNNFLRSPWTTLRHNFLSNYQEFFDWRDEAVFDYDTMAVWSWHNRLGQCEENAAVTYYILKKAGYDVGIYRQEPGDHKYVIMNPKQGMSMSDSRTWGKDTFIVDSWQGKVLDKDAAYENKHVFRGGEIRSHEDTPQYTNTIKKDLKQRNICWDSKKKVWACKKGYEKKFMKGAYQGFCVEK